MRPPFEAGLVVNLTGDSLAVRRVAHGRGRAGPVTDYIENFHQQPERFDRPHQPLLFLL